MKMYTRFLSVAAATLFITALIASCGGGGGGGGYTAPAPPMLTPATLQADGYYINVHTDACPDGEIRGQILAAGLTGPQTIPLTLTNAAPACATAGAGASGSGNIVVNVDTGAVTSVSITTANLSGAATLAHIHEGAAGVAGPARVTLTVSGNMVTLNIGGGTIGY